MDVRPIARAASEELADAYSGRIDSKPHYAHLERTATLGLLSDVAGARVLVPGCGPGAYAVRLVDRGAAVVGVDASEPMGQPLAFDDDAFDVVQSALALHPVAALGCALGGFRRVLRPGRALVCSVRHPFADHRRLGRDNFGSERLYEVWTGFGAPVEVPAYRRPLAAALSPSSAPASGWGG